MAPPRLFLRFALFSGVVLIVAVGLALLLTRWNANDRARGRAVGEATAVARQLATDDLAETAFKWPRPSGAAGEDLLFFLDDFFSPTVSGHEPPNVLLYSPEGYVTYAIDRDLIGNRPDDVSRIKDALERPQYTVADDLQSTYVPVTWAFAPNTVRGVMQLQHDYRPIAAEIQDEFRGQAATIALALIGLYLAMLPIMRRITSSLRRGYLEHAELAAIVDHSNDAIIGQTPERLISSWNAGAEQVYGWKAEEVVGRSIDVLLPEQGTAEPSSSELDAARTTHVHKNGSPVSVSVTVSPILDANGNLVGSSMIARDVTQLEQLEGELRESHRQEAVGRLASGIARDFGELLGEIDTAAANLPLDSSSRDLEQIRRATARGASLTDQLLAVGGAQEASPELIDLNDAIKQALPRLTELVGSQIIVSTELAHGLGTVFADREQVDQLIVNLAANARDSMPGGGWLVIETANVDFARRARDGGEEPGHYVMFGLADTGLGPAPEASARPFEPFLRRSEGGERMALGLAAVFGIVKQSGGTLGVERRPGEGTMIRIYLPRVDAPVPAASPA